MSKVSCLELFAGAGGLAKGLGLSGAQHTAFIEWNRNACQTLTHNYKRELIHNTDIRDFDFDRFGYVDMISGGPPCQPFSMGGKHQGNLDQRDMFPYACKAISSCVPKTFVFENVKGLLRKSFRGYFEYVLLRLTYPNVGIGHQENWEEHLSRLEKLHTAGNYNGIKYNVIFRLIDAANYGIPQRRERVFIVGVREDLNIEWSFPQPTHSLEALLWSQFVSGDYWARHHIKRPSIDILDTQVQRRIENLKQQPAFFPPSLQPWKTVRDQVGNLPSPAREGSFNPEHTLREGAKSYPGHTGSYIDMPSKALKAGGHGVPGGENMIRYHDGRVRYYTTYEAKRVQTFPPDYRILGSWSESMRQIGNAVPVELSQKIAGSLVNAIQKTI